MRKSNFTNVSVRMKVLPVNKNPGRLVKSAGYMSENIAIEETKGAYSLIKDDKPQKISLL